MHRPLAAATLCVALLAASATARPDSAVQLNDILEQNAAASAYARACNDEPIADQLKSSTMMLLAVNGVDPQTIQLGSAKFNDVVRQQLGRMKAPTDCREGMRIALDRLAFTQRSIAAGRRDPAPNQ